MAKQIMDMNYYQLYPDYSAMFRIENEKNKEFMWVRTCTAIVPSSGPGNDWEGLCLSCRIPERPIKRTHLSEYPGVITQHNIHFGWLLQFIRIQ